MLLPNSAAKELNVTNTKYESGPTKSSNGPTTTYFISLIIKTTTHWTPPSSLSMLLLFCFICHIYPPFTRKRIVSLYFGREVRTRLGVAFFEVYGPPVFHIKVGRPVKYLAQGHNKRTCRLVLHNLF